MRTGIDVDVDAAKTLGDRLDVHNSQPRQRERTPSLLCLSFSLDRRLSRCAMADRFSSALELSRLAHLRSQCRVHNVTKYVRDHHPQIGKLEIGDVQWLAWGLRRGDKPK